MEARTNAIINKAEDLVLADRAIKVSVIAIEVGASETIVFKVVHKDLGLRKVLTQWTPKHLDPNQQLCR